MKNLKSYITEAVKINAKDVYFDNDEIVWKDTTIGYKWDDGGLEILPKYKSYANDILKIFKKLYKYDDWYIVED